MLSHGDLSRVYHPRYVFSGEGIRIERPPQPLKPPRFEAFTDQPSEVFAFAPDVLALKNSVHSAGRLGHRYHRQATRALQQVKASTFVVKSLA
jgi:hypothetical protein